MSAWTRPTCEGSEFLVLRPSSRALLASHALRAPQYGLACDIVLQHASMYTHVSTAGAPMRLQIAKWGNSLAVRLPMECARAAGLQEGDRVVASITRAGQITLAPDKVFKKAAFLTRLAKLHAAMPMTEPVVERMRQEARC